MYVQFWYEVKNTNLTSCMIACKALRIKSLFKRATCTWPIFRKIFWKFFKFCITLGEFQLFFLIGKQIALCIFSLTATKLYRTPERLNWLKKDYRVVLMSSDSCIFSLPLDIIGHHLKAKCRPDMSTQVSFSRLKGYFLNWTKLVRCTCRYRPVQ
jgi:hypothetical protein